MRERQPLTAANLGQLTDSITELTQQIEVLRDVLDEIRSDIQWAVHNGRLIALPLTSLESTAVNGIAADAASPEWGNRLKTKRLQTPGEDEVRQVTRTVDSVIDQVMTATVGLSWVRDQVRQQADAAEADLDDDVPANDNGPPDGKTRHCPASKTTEQSPVGVGNPPAAESAAEVPPASQHPAVQRHLFDIAADSKPGSGSRAATVQRPARVRSRPAPPSTPLPIPSGRVNRIRPPVKAHGGKYYLAPKIVPILLSAPGPVTEYLEPCAYGASVFLALPRFEREILGDINPEVVDLWRVLADNGLAEQLRNRISQTPYTESEFETAKHGTSVTAIARAFHTIVKCRFSRGGLGKNFAWSQRRRGGRPGDENAWRTFAERELPRIIERAQRIEVTSDPCWWTVWESRQRIHRLIYADPPYMRGTRTAKAAYGPYEMTRLHHFWLVAALRAHSGPAAISGYRCEGYDQWLRDWCRIDFDMPNNSGQGRKKQRRIESLWINW